MTALAAPERALQHTAAPMPADVAGRTALAPLETLYDPGQGDGLPLPAALAGLYGPLRLPTPAGRPIVLGNFVTTLEGVVSLGVPGQAGGGPISGFNPHDRMVMGLLRAAADAVIVGAGTLRAVAQVRPATAILVEGGPRLIGDFFAAQGLDVLFLTLAPQVAGRDRAAERPGLVAGQIFAPDHPVWSTLAGVKRAGSHLFLRYEFAPDPARPAAPLPGGRL
jgi:hypothetical protein